MYRLGEKLGEHSQPLNYFSQRFFKEHSRCWQNDSNCKQQSIVVSNEVIDGGGWFEGKEESVFFKKEGSKDNEFPLTPEELMISIYYS
jgi:hypothetical protein